MGGTANLLEKVPPPMLSVDALSLFVAKQLAHHDPFYSQTLWHTPEQPIGAETRSRTRLSTIGRYRSVKTSVILGEIVFWPDGRFAQLANPRLAIYRGIAVKWQHPRVSFSDRAIRFCTSCTF